MTLRKRSNFSTHAIWTCDKPPGTPSKPPATNNKRTVGGVVAVDIKILGVVDNLDEVVDTRVEKERIASITDRSRVVCTFQVISIEPFRQTNSGSGEIFAAKYKVNRP